jgi:hypothetical protein
MTGLSDGEAEFRRRGLQLAYVHNEALEPRTGKLAFGIPYEILLGMLCHSNANVEKAANFFLTLAKEHFPAVAEYLAGFVSRIGKECDFSATDLRVKPEMRHTAMDFPRPSPARMLVWDFAKRLASNRQLHLVLSNTHGSDWFFHEASTE